ncbi:MAG: hypothetical protein QM523_09235 [Candidatus Pacebacteria bacterium]|nr:hypothetical protein [Candidatus Paceibacterota bacterium]
MINLVMFFIGNLMLVLLLLVRSRMKNAAIYRAHVDLENLRNRIMFDLDDEYQGIDNKGIKLMLLHIDYLKDSVKDFRASNLVTYNYELLRDVKMQKMMQAEYEKMMSQMKFSDHHLRNLQDILSRLMYHRSFLGLIFFVIWQCGYKQFIAKEIGSILSIKIETYGQDKATHKNPKSAPKKSLEQYLEQYEDKRLDAKELYMIGFVVNRPALNS